MVQTQPGVALKAMADVVPEGVDARLAGLLTQRVSPALLDKAGVGGAALRLDQRIVVPGFRRVNVDLGRRDIEVAGEDHRRAGLQQFSGVSGKALEPLQLVVE